MMRKQYTAAFKARVVQELLKEEKTLAQIAAEYEVHPTQLKNWRATAVEGLPGLFEKQDSTVVLKAAHEQQLTELYAEIGKLTTQVAWLKKQLEQECLTEFLQVLSNLRSHLVQCYDYQDFPRTNNDMERSIRGLKTQYRRVSGRKNWNAYLLRYGRCVAYAAWWEQDAAHRQHLEQQVGRLDRTRWRELRQESSCAHSEQLTRFRFRHKRQALLASLEERWAVATQSVPLP